MTDDPKKAKFQATQPQIPGVPGRQPQQPAGTTATPVTASVATTITPKTAKAPKTHAQPFYVWAAGGGAILVVIIAIFWWAFGASKATNNAPVTATPVTATIPALPKPTETLPVAPGPIATVSQMREPWSTRKFFYRRTDGTVTPAMLVHLHGDTYWAFSLLEPFGNCELELASVDRLRDYYDLAAKYPMVADPCSRTVYDLTRYGNGPNGLVRGAIVAGTGSRPPLAIEVEVEGEKIVASRSE
jgi:hypothetical protein